MVACKTVGEYKCNQEKIRKFCLEEAKAAKKAQSSSQGNSPGKGHSKRITQLSQPKQSPAKPKAKIETKWKEKLVKLTTRNQTRHQTKSKAPPRAQRGMLKKFNASTPKQSFNYKAQQAALLEPANIASTSKASTFQAAQPPSEVFNRSFLIFNFNETDQSNIQTHFIESDNPDSPHHLIHTSDYPSDFMRTSPDSSPINAMEISTPDEEHDQAEPRLISIIPASNSQIQQTPSGEKDEFGANRDSFVKSTAKSDKTVNKILSAQGKPISSTPLSQLCVSQPMEQSPPATKKAPENIYLDSSNSSQDTSRGIPEQQMPTHTEPRSEVYNSSHSSSVYKTPPSSPKNDSISDLNDEDIQEWNKNF